MVQMLFLDLAPDPTPGGARVLVAVLLLVIALLALLAAGLVVFLWYRKRSRRGVEMIRADNEMHRKAKSAGQD